MRKKRDQQRTFQELKANWTKAKELSMIDQILCDNSILCELVWQDFNRGRGKILIEAARVGPEPKA